MKAPGYTNQRADDPRAGSTMSRSQLQSLYPNASESFLRANCDRSQPLPALLKERPQGDALEQALSRKETRRHRFTIRFDIFSSRPADWDNYNIKELQDLLIIIGLLPGDDWTTLPCGQIHTHKVSRRADNKTVITITEICENAVT